ncbi:expressed unknown protein [Seminavis robusta]|uniref:Inward rectifier potassium channel C-terminal domain-containing protein n=1 Tax=Seminavis robusta TaxID=568900 RepID=A0A9N8E5D9_9STRA|nr:expressed unknown protein [Seminavis robusta]|eukprot:Sro517_g158630.1 n/a (963) ;mRNA; f:12356-15601
MDDDIENALTSRHHLHHLSTVHEELSPLDLDLSDSLSGHDENVAYARHPNGPLTSQQVPSLSPPGAATTTSSDGNPINYNSRPSQDALIPDADNNEYTEPMNLPDISESNNEVSGGNTLADLLSTDNNNIEENNTNSRRRQDSFRGSGNRGLYRRPARQDVKRESIKKEHGQHVSMVTGSMRNAMDEKVRRRERFKKQINNLFRSKDSDDEDDEEGIGGTKISMHGRLMVQPSRRHLVIPPSSSAESGGKTQEEYDEEEAAERKREETQYRLTTVKGKRRNALTVKGMYEDLTKGEGDTCDTCFCCFLCCQGSSSERFMSAFLHWAFRSPFVVVFGTAAIGWIAMTFLFAFVIWVIGAFKPHCIGGVDFALSPGRFMDAYQLSWTTFSTVGYGLIYPATSANHHNIKNCTEITILATFESFVGVLFSSLCAALMFAKVARVQSFAQVTFSDPMVIRFGDGVNPDDNDLDASDDEDDAISNRSGGSNNKPKKKHSSDHRIPCPVLEFRIFNRMDSIPGGEIIDATLNMVAVIDPSQADMSLAGKRGRRKRGKKKRGPMKQQKTLSMRFMDDDNDADDDADENDDGGVPKTDSMNSEASSPTTQNNASPPPPPPEETSPVLSKPSIVTFQQSTAERGTSLPLRGPAPALTRRGTTESIPQRAPPPSLTRRGTSEGIPPRERTPPPPLTRLGTSEDVHSHRAMHPLHQHTHPQQVLPQPQLRPTQSLGSRTGTVRRTRPQNGYSSLRGSNTSSFGRQSIMDRFKARLHRHDSNQSTGSNFGSPSSLNHPNSLNNVSTRTGNRTLQAFDEDPTGKLVAKQMLCKLDLDSPDHPFFRRIWLVRHTLDLNSLLLKPHVRVLLRKNHGYWPKELNNYESIRASIDFDQILVSLSGTSNADANSVYAQHVYNMIDVNVGYRFVNALYRDPNDGSLRVDQTLINDVMEQAGGGGEPFQDFDEENFREMLVL